MTSITLTDTHRELDARESNGISVSLRWDPTTEAVYVDVFDARTLEQLRLVISPEHALDAFHHPFAYAAAQGLLDVREDDFVIEVEELV